MYEGRPGKKAAGGLQITRRIDFLNVKDETKLSYLEFADISKADLGYAIEDKESGEIIEYTNTGGQVLGKLLEMSGLAYEDAEAGKIYYLSSFDIYIKLRDGRIYNLLPESGIYPSLVNEEAFKKVMDKAKK